MSIKFLDILKTILYDVPNIPSHPNLRDPRKRSRWRRKGGERVAAPAAQHMPGRDLRRLGRGHRKRIFEIAKVGGWPKQQGQSTWVS